MAGWGTDDELVTGGWGTDDELVVESRPLPADVKPSTAGAGRSSGIGGALPAQSKADTPDYSFFSNAAPSLTPHDPNSLDAPQQRQGEQLLRPEYIDQVRTELLANVPVEQRLQVLRAAAAGTNVKSRAARQILTEVEGENSLVTEGDENKARQLKLGPLVQPPSGGAASKPAKLAAPDTQPGFGDIMDGTSQADIATRRALAGDVAKARTKGAVLDSKADRDQTAEGTRTLGEFGMDTLISLGKGGNSVMTLPMALLAPGGDFYTSLKEQRAQLDEMESPELRARREKAAERIASVEGELPKFLVSAYDLAANPSLGFSVVAEQAAIMGSIVALGAAGGAATVGALSLAGRAKPVLAIATEIGGWANAARSAGSIATAGAASGIAAGGDAAQSTYDRLVDPRQTAQSLLDANPDYQALVAGGMSAKQARHEIAVSKSRMAAMFAAPLGIMSGATGLESALFKGGKAGLMAGLKAVGIELGGEMFEEVGTQVAGNFAVGTVDPSVPLMEGTGEVAANTLFGSGPGALAAGAAHGVRREGEDLVADAVARGRFDPQSLDPRLLDPSQTVMTPDQRAARAPKVEDMPTTILSDAELAAEIDSGTVAPVAAPAADPAALGVSAVPPGALAAQSEQQLRENAQETAGGSTTQADLADPLAPGGPASADPTGGAGAAVTDGRSGGLGLGEGAAAPDRPSGEGQPVLPPAVGPDATLSDGGQTGTDGLRQRGAGGASDASRGLAQARTVYERARATAVSDVAKHTTQATQLEARARQLRLAGTPDSVTAAERLETRATELRQHAEILQHEGERQPQLNEPPAGPALNQFEAVADAIEQLTGRRPVAYHDARQAAVDGFTDGTTAYVNLSTPEQSVGFTVFHEMQHIVRQEAEGGNVRAKLATQMLDQVWGMIDDKAKRRYAEAYLFKADLQAKAMTIEEAMASPLLKDEMLSDFMGKRADDVEFMRKMAKAHPSQFAGFAQRWIDLLGQLIDKLRGRSTKGDVKDIDSAIKDLERAKAVAEGVLKEWVELNPALARRQNVSAPATVETVEGETAATKASARAQDGPPRGVNVEVAPNPDKPEAKRFAALPKDEQSELTGTVATVINQVFNELQADGWTYAQTTGRFEGESNASLLVKAPANATEAEISEMARVLGYVLDQKAAIAFDEANTTSDSQTGFVKVILPAGLSTEQVESVRDAITKAVPQATGDTLRDGALVYGNFSQYSDAPIDDAAFHQAINAAIAAADVVDGLVVAGPFRFHSEYIEPGTRDGYLEGTRYGEGNDEGAAAGRDGVRGRGRGDLSRLKGLARLATERRDKGIAHYERRRAEGAAGVPQNRAASVGPKPGRSYGHPARGAVAVDAFHFSAQARPVLSSQAYGTGLTGSGFDTFRNAADQRLAQRIHFYFNRGEGIHPEAGVGGQLHRVELKNLYDVDADPLGLRGAGQGMSLEAQSKILDAGFDGFMLRGHNQSGLAVLLGNRSVPVETLGQQAGKFNGGQTAPKFSGKIWRSGRQDFSMDDVDNFDDPGYDDDKIPVGESKPLTDDEKDAIRRELEAEQGFSGIPEGLATPVPYKMPDAKSLKAAGLFAETAFADLQYATDDTGVALAVTTLADRSRMFRISPLGADSYRASPGDMSHLGDGAAFGIKGTFELAKRWNQQVAASAVLHDTGYDLASAVSPAVNARIVKTWKAIAALPGATEFGSSVAVKGFNTSALYRVAESLLDGSRYEFGVADGGSRAMALTITDTKTGTAGTSMITLDGARNDTHLTMHTNDLEAGSGIGKPFYQVAFAFGHEIGVATNADSQGLLGVNNVRRTEQMMSAAARAGDAGAVNPGIGQRIYGWNPSAKTQAQKDRNFARIALAAARNAAEVAPRVKDLGYDLKTDKFTWRRGSGDAEGFVKALLDDGDARALSVSRSTLARAAVTFAAIDGDVVLPQRVSKPVLYSARGSMLSEYAGVDQGGQSDSNAGDGPEQGNYDQLVGKPIERAFVLADGRQAALRLDAAKALTDIDERIDTAKELRKCLARAA